MMGNNIKDIQSQHTAWVESMGWHNKQPLEYLALIGSEVGEAVNECRGSTPSDTLGSELADIILRVLDFASTQGFDIGSVDNFRGRSFKDVQASYTDIDPANMLPLEHLASVIYAVGKAIRECKSATASDKLKHALLVIFIMVLDFANTQGICMDTEISKKMEVNLKYLKTN